MVKRYWFFAVFFAVAVVALSVAGLGCKGQTASHRGDPPSVGDLDEGADMPDKIKKTDEEWRTILTPEQYEITRQGGTEPPFTGEYNEFKGDGIFVCVGCRNELFASDTKFNSGSGWPSFWAPVSEADVKTRTDTTHGMIRIEARCARCDAHLGHVFEDGPEPSGLRYCINSAALDFVGKPPKTDPKK